MTKLKNIDKNFTKKHLHSFLKCVKIFTMKPIRLEVPRLSDNNAENGYNQVSGCSALNECKI